jgi:hypothetical protein
VSAAAVLVAAVVLHTSGTGSLYSIAGCPHPYVTYVGRNMFVDSVVQCYPGLATGGWSGVFPPSGHSLQADKRSKQSIMQIVFSS